MTFFQRKKLRKPRGQIQLLENKQILCNISRFLTLRFRQIAFLMTCQQHKNTNWNLKYFFFYCQSKDKTPVKAIVEPTIISWCVSWIVSLTWWAILISNSKYCLIQFSSTSNVSWWYFSRGLNVSIFKGIYSSFSLILLTLFT